MPPGLGTVIADAAGAGHTAAINAVTLASATQEAACAFLADDLKLLSHLHRRELLKAILQVTARFGESMGWAPCTSTISALSVGHQIAMAGQDVAISAMLGRIWPDHAPDASQVIVFQCSTGPSAPQMVRGSLWEVSYVLHTCVLWRFFFPTNIDRLRPPMAETPLGHSVRLLMFLAMRQALKVGMNWDTCYRTCQQNPCRTSRG